MGDKSKIQWTNATWNPVTGCSKVSAGCRGCYAERHALRFWGDRKFTDVRTHMEKLEQPLRWKRPRLIFVNSMSDLFHEDVPDEFIKHVFNVMHRAQHHTFQILTKRPERMHAFMMRYREVMPLPNVWLGVSIEDQQTAVLRIPWLSNTPAAVRFISAEPLLGHIDITAAMLSKRIHWVIVGGESGPTARPCHPNWVRIIRHQCNFFGVPFFFKQWGQWKPVTRDPHARKMMLNHPDKYHVWPDEGHESTVSIRCRKSDAGNELDGKYHMEFPRGVDVQRIEYSRQDQFSFGGEQGTSTPPPGPSLTGQRGVVECKGSATQR